MGMLIGSADAVHMLIYCVLIIGICVPLMVRKFRRAN
jgi:hypothetical protein